jgi:hypothetical protein
LSGSRSGCSEADTAVAQCSPRMYSRSRSSTET